MYNRRAARTSPFARFTIMKSENKGTNKGKTSWCKSSGLNKPSALRQMVQWESCGHMETMTQSFFIFFYIFQGLTWSERTRDIKVTGVNVCVIVLQGCISTKAWCKGKQKEAETLKCSYRQQSVFITWQVLLLDSVGALPVESVYHVLLVSAFYPVTNGKEIKKSFPLWRNSFSCYKTLAKEDRYIFFSVNIWF